MTGGPTQCLQAFYSLIDTGVYLDLFHQTSTQISPQRSEVRLIELTADIAAAHLSHNRVPVDKVAEVIGGIYNALAGLRDYWSHDFC